MSIYRFGQREFDQEGLTKYTVHGRLLSASPLLLPFPCGFSGSVEVCATDRCGRIWILKLPLGNQKRSLEEIFHDTITAITDFRGTAAKTMWNDY